MVPTDSTRPLRIYLLGPFEAYLEGAPLPPLRTRKVRWLLALLTLRHGQAVERDWLAGLLWPDQPTQQGRALLRRELNDLRRALGQEAARLFSPTPHTLCLKLAGAEADVIALDAAIAQGGTAALEQAVALYRGPLLEGCAEEWVVQERSQREQAFLAALETLAERALIDTAASTAESYMRRAVAVDPLRESAQRLLMQALAAGGNYAAALLTYRDQRLRLHRELNTEPDPETQAFFQQLRAEARGKAAVRQGAGARSHEPGTGFAPDCPLPPAPCPLPGGTVTFLFTDIAGSSRLWERHPAAMREALARHDALLRQVIEGHGGAVFKTVGDQVCAAFSTAPDAVAAALDAQRALQGESWGETGPLQARMALHTGVAEVREADYLGPPLNRVARLVEAGHGGQILLSQTTADLVRDALRGDAGVRELGEFRLRDLTRPERVYQLLHPDLAADFPPLRSHGLPPNKLPAPLSTLIGRQAEVETARELLRRESVRLLSLTGPGGTGKTRLALQVVANPLNPFQDGIFFVDLAPITDPGLVTATIAHALEVREKPGQTLLQTLKDFLRDKQLLLLLDNFEQVLDAAPVVADLLMAAPRLKALVTSRAPLHLQGEHAFPVPPLALPDPERLPPIEALAEYAAVRLFVERASAARPDFALTRETGPAVAAICQRLDGLPLAIELAAARVRFLPPPALLSRLESCLKLLTGGARDLPARHQTLRNAIAWSYDLLEEGAQKLFHRLAVFVGGCTLEAIEAVCNAEGDLPTDVLEGVAFLVEMSLVEQRGPRDGEPRLVLLETIREFASERLVESEEAPALRREHAQFYVALAEETAADYCREPADRSRLEPAAAELDNIRAALAWIVESHDASLGLRLGPVLPDIWLSAGSRSELRRHLAAILALPGATAPIRARCDVLVSAGMLAHGQGDDATAQALFEEYLAIQQSLGDKAAIMDAYERLGLVLRDQGDYERAHYHYRQALRLAEEAEDHVCVAIALYSLGYVAYLQEAYEQAQRLLEQGLTTLRQEPGAEYPTAWNLAHLGEVADARGEYEAGCQRLFESLAIWRERDDRWAISYTLHCLGRVALHQGDTQKARAWFTESLTISREQENQRCIAECMEGLAGVACQEDHPWRAARLLGAAVIAREAVSIAPRPIDRADRERFQAIARDALGEEAFAAAWAEGQAMSLEDAIVFALDTPTVFPGQSS